MIPIQKLTLLIILHFILLFPGSILAWSGKCVGVQDGDTITVLRNEKQEIRIRLYGVDCPEKGQAFGTKAKKFTSDLVFKKAVEIKPTDTDRYGRTIAWVYIDGKCVGEELLKAGLAWHYKKYSKEHHLAELEEHARKNRIGLWSDSHRIPPWEWRKR